MPKLQDTTITRRTAMATIGGSVAAMAAPCRPARADVPLIRYATTGLVGPGEFESIVLCDWMKANVLRRHGKAYTIEATSTRGTPEVATLMAAGSIDMGTCAFPVLATVVQKDAIPGGLKAVAEIHRDGQPGYASNPFCVLDDSPIRAIGDLKGKTIAVNAYGTIVDILLRYALKKNGLDPKTDVRIVEISFPNIGPAIRQKRVDAGVLVMPFQVDEIDRGGIRRLFDSIGLIDPYPILFQAVRTDFARANGDALKAWLADYVEAQRWIYDEKNRDKVMELTAGLMKTSPNALRSYFLTTRDFYRDPSACLSRKSLQEAVDAMSNLGLLAGRVSIASAVDNSYLPASCEA